METPGTVLLERAGLLARYGKLGLLERLRAAGAGDRPLRGVWLLLPADDQMDRPTLDESVIPVLTPNEWMDSPLLAAQPASRGEPKRRMIDRAALLARLKPVVTAFEDDIRVRVGELSNTY